MNMEQYFKEQFNCAANIVKALQTGNTENITKTTALLALHIFSGHPMLPDKSRIEFLQVIGKHLEITAAPKVTVPSLFAESEDE